MPLHFASRVARVHTADAWEALAPAVGRCWRMQCAVCLRSGGSVSEKQDRSALTCLRALRNLSHSANVDCSCVSGASFDDDAFSTQLRFAQPFHRGRSDRGARPAVPGGWFGFSEGDEAGARVGLADIVRRVRFGHPEDELRGEGNRRSPHDFRQIEFSLRPLLAGCETRRGVPKQGDARRGGKPYQGF